MFGLRLTLKSVTLLLLGFSLSEMTSAHDAQRLRLLADVDGIMMPSSDAYAHGERRLNWNFWSSFMFEVFGSFCADQNGHCRPMCGPPPPFCHEDDANYTPDNPTCQICKPKPKKKKSSSSSSGSSSTEDSYGCTKGECTCSYTDDCTCKTDGYCPEYNCEGDDCADSSCEGENCDESPCDDCVDTDEKEDDSSGLGQVCKSMARYLAAAAVVGLMGAGFMMHKRRNAVEAKESRENGLSGAVSTRAAALLGEGAVADAGAAAALPKFLSVPSLRRSPSGLEVNSNGDVLEQSPSNYYEMEGGVDDSQLPHGVEISANGSLNSYMV